MSDEQVAKCFRVEVERVQTAEVFIICEDGKEPSCKDAEAAAKAILLFSYEWFDSILDINHVEEVSPEEGGHIWMKEAKRIAQGVDEERLFKEPQP